MLKKASKIRCLPFSFSAISNTWCICRFVLWMNHLPSIGSIPLTSSLYTVVHFFSNSLTLGYSNLCTMRFHLEIRLSSLLFESSNWLLRWHSSCTWSFVGRFRNHTIALHTHNCVSICRLLPDICPSIFLQWKRCKLFRDQEILTI